MIRDVVILATAIGGLIMFINGNVTACLLFFILSELCLVTKNLEKIVDKNKC
jgi:hypothetical protein